MKSLFFLPRPSRKNFSLAVFESQFKETRLATKFLSSTIADAWCLENNLAA